MGRNILNEFDGGMVSLSVGDASTFLCPCTNKYLCTIPFSTSRMYILEESIQNKIHRRLLVLLLLLTMMTQYVPVLYSHIYAYIIDMYNTASFHWAYFAFGLAVFIPHTRITIVHNE